MRLWRELLMPLALVAIYFQDESAGMHMVSMCDNSAYLSSSAPSSSSHQTAPSPTTTTTTTTNTTTNTTTTTTNTTNTIHSDNDVRTTTTTINNRNRRHSMEMGGGTHNRASREAPSQSNAKVIIILSYDPSEINENREETTKSDTTSTTVSPSSSAHSVTNHKSMHSNSTGSSVDPTTTIPPVGRGRRKTTTPIPTTETTTNPTNPTIPSLTSCECTVVTDYQFSLVLLSSSLDSNSDQSSTVGEVRRRLDLRDSCSNRTFDLADFKNQTAFQSCPGNTSVHISVTEMGAKVAPSRLLLAIEGAADVKIGCGSGNHLHNNNSQHNRSSHLPSIQVQKDPIVDGQKGSIVDGNGGVEGTTGTGVNSCNSLCAIIVSLVGLMFIMVTIAFVFLLRNSRSVNVASTSEIKSEQNSVKRQEYHNYEDIDDVKNNIASSKAKDGAAPVHVPASPLESIELNLTGDYSNAYDDDQRSMGMEYSTAKDAVPAESLPPFLCSISTDSKQNYFDGRGLMASYEDLPQNDSHGSK